MKTFITTYKCYYTYRMNVHLKEGLVNKFMLCFNSMVICTNNNANLQQHIAITTISSTSNYKRILKVCQFTAHFHSWGDKVQLLDRSDTVHVSIVSDSPNYTFNVNP